MRYVFCLSCLILTTFCGVVFAGSEDEIRLAVFAEKGSQVYESGLVSLLEVSLSEYDSVKLLDREHISKILQEHKLSLGGLTKRDNAIKAVKLLRAKALVLLNVESKAKDGSILLMVRILETTYGIRLSDTFQQLDIKNQEKTSKLITAKVKRVLDDWCSMASTIEYKSLQSFVKRLRNHEYGILNHADYPISTSSLVRLRFPSLGPGGRCL